MDFQETQSPLEGQEDWVQVKGPGWYLPSSLASLWSSWPSFWLWVPWKSIKLLQLYHKLSLSPGSSWLLLPPGGGEEEPGGARRSQ